MKLRRRREALYSDAAVLLQSSVRGWLARRRYRVVLRGIVLLQSHFRRRKARLQFKLLRIEARSIGHMQTVNKGLENKIIELQQRLDERTKEVRGIFLPAQKKMVMFFLILLIIDLLVVILEFCFLFGEEKENFKSAPFFLTTCIFASIVPLLLQVTVLSTEKDKLSRATAQLDRLAKVEESAEAAGRKAGDLEAELVRLRAELEREKAARATAEKEKAAQAKEHADIVSLMRAEKESLQELVREQEEELESRSGERFCGSLSDLELRMQADYL